MAHMAQPTGEERHPHGGEWLREVIFGLNDGLVTTLVFVLTVSEITHSATLVLVVLSAVFAGGISMALGGYLSTATEREVIDRRIETERHEIAHEAEEERAELRAIYRQKGLYEPLVEDVVDHLTADEDRWLRALVSDELGVVPGSVIRPWRDGLLFGGSFVVGGLVPTLPLLLNAPSPRVLAYVLTAVTALALGVVKARYTLKGPIRSSLEFLAIVTAGALAGLAIGTLLHTL